MNGKFLPTLCIHTKSHTSAKSWKVAIGPCKAVPIVHGDSMLYIWMSVEMDTISQRKCNWGDNGWMIGTGHKQFFCQGYKAWLRKLPTLTDPGQNRISTMMPPVCWRGCQWRCFHSHRMKQRSLLVPILESPAINRSLFSHRHKSTCCTGRSPMAVCSMWYFEAMIFINTAAGLRNQKERHTQEWPSSPRIC